MTSIHQEPQHWGARGQLFRAHQRRLGWALAVLSFPLVSLWVERWALPLAVSRALPALQALDAHLQKAPDGDEFGPGESAQDLTPARLTLDAGAGPGAPRKGNVAHSVHVPKQQVLQWVKARTIPRGRSVRRTWYLPEGLEVQGAAAFGVGLTNRDRLIQVDGQPVSAASHAVEAVLQAVGRQASMVHGVFMRETETAVVTTSLQVELPDLEALAEDEAAATAVVEEKAK